jgi:CheY-like chemotaxis protein
MDLRALVVCPDQDSASLLTLILADLGITAEHTPSITRGLELLDSRRFDAIVLDYRADQSSEDFLTHLRQSARNRASMLIAIVDAGFNARPVFGLGANFVLYRPLTSERTRISLRAARGLLRRERRRAPRKPVSAPINVAYPGAPESKALIADLSESGAQIQNTSRLPALCKVYFEFTLPSQKQMVRLSGEVAWQDSSGRTGIRFLDVPQSSRRLMQNWLRNSVAPAPGVSSGETSGGTSPAQALSTPQPESQFELTPVAKTADRVSGASNRRGELRFACKIGAEVYHLGSTVPNRCNLSDISEGGCYVETPSPFAGQSGVEILVRTADTKFKISGQVLVAHPGFGMGVRFMFRDSAEREEILRLLAVLANGPSLDEQPR